MHEGLARRAAWPLAIIINLISFVLVVILVWAAYVYLYAYQPDVLGWCYATLRPVTIWLYNLVDFSLPEAVKYKVSAGLTTELGAPSLLLLILGALGHTLVSSVFWLIGFLFRLATGRVGQEA